MRSLIAFVLASFGRWAPLIPILMFDFLWMLNSSVFADEAMNRNRWSVRVPALSLRLSVSPRGRHLLASRWATSMAMAAVISPW